MSHALIERSLYQIQLDVHEGLENPREWCLAWATAIGRLDVKGVVKACRSEIESKSDATSAKALLFYLRRGERLAVEARELERDCTNLYPKDKARHRLDHELGWEQDPNDDSVRKLDRSIMIGRVKAKPDAFIIADAWRSLRNRYVSIDGGDR